MAGLHAMKDNHYVHPGQIEGNFEVFFFSLFSVLCLSRLVVGGWFWVFRNQKPPNLNKISLGR